MLDPRETLIVGTTMAYEQLFASGGEPEAMKLVLPDQDGYWKVKILSGPFPDMGGRWFRHRKVFRPVKRPEDNVSLNVDVVGYNVLFRDSQWGHFVVSRGFGYDGRLCLILDYDVMANSFFTDKIVDHVRSTSDPNLLIGKLYVGDWFGGYFTLEKVVSS